MDFEKEFIKLLGDDYSNYDECNDYSESQGDLELLSPFPREKYNINVVFIVDEEIQSDDITELKNTNFLTEYIERDICGDFI